MDLFIKQTQEDYNFWKNQTYFQLLKDKHANLINRIERYQHNFNTKFQYMDAYLPSKNMYNEIESMDLDFDHLLIELTQDLNFIKLNTISNSIWKMFYTLTNIQKLILRKNQCLIDLTAEYKKRQEHSINKLVCEICDKRLEEVKLKGLLPKTTKATHQIKDQSEKTKQKKKQLQNQIKRLDLDNFYGGDRDILMRKIGQLLNQKSISLNRKAAETQQTLRAALNDYFDKGGIQQILNNGQYCITEYEQKLDLVDDFTNTLKQELLLHADPPLRKFVDKLSDLKLKMLLAKKKSSLITNQTQTIDTKYIQVIKGLQLKLKSLNMEINGRKIRTQQIQKQLMNEMIQLNNCQKKMIEANKKLQLAEKQVKTHFNINKQLTLKLEAQAQQKNEQIQLLKKNILETESFYKKEINSLQQQLHIVQKKLAIYIQNSNKIYYSNQTQTVFLKKNQQIQTESTPNFYSAKSGKSIGGKISNQSEIIEDQEDVKDIKDLKKSKRLIEKNIEQRSTNLNNTNNNNANNSNNSTIKTPILKDSNRPIRKVDFQKQIDETRFQKVRTSMTMKSQRKYMPDKVITNTKQKTLKNKINDSGTLSPNINQINSSTFPLPSLKTQYTTNRSIDSIDQQQNRFDKIIQAEEIQQTDRHKTTLQFSADIRIQKQNTEIRKDVITQFDKQIKNEIREIGKSLKKMTKNRVRITKPDHLRKISKARYSEVVAQRLFATISPNLINDQSNKDKADRLKLVIEQSFQFLDKIGIISILEKLHSKNAQSRRMFSFENLLRKNGKRLIKKKPQQSKLSTQIKQTPLLVLTTKDFDLFGGYQNAIKFEHKKGVWAPDSLSLDNNSIQINQIYKFICEIKDLTKKNIILSYLCYPVQTIVYQLKKDVDQQTLKVALKNLIRYHVVCKPKCSHLKNFCARIGLFDIAF